MMYTHTRTRCPPPLGYERRADLEVAVDDALLVQVLYGQRDLGSVEPGTVLAEDSLAGQVEEELTTIDVLHDKAEPVRCLEGVVEGLEGEGGGRGGEGREGRGGEGREEGRGGNMCCKLVHAPR